MLIHGYDFCREGGGGGKASVGSVIRIVILQLVMLSVAFTRIYLESLEGTSVIDSKKK